MKPDDERLKTDLPPGPYIEACKVWGSECARRNLTGQYQELMLFTVFLDCLRVYEFERSRAPGQQTKEARQP